MLKNDAEDEDRKCILHTQAMESSVYVCMDSPISFSCQGSGSLSFEWVFSFCWVVFLSGGHFCAQPADVMMVTSLPSVQKRSVAPLSSPKHV